MYEGDKTPLEIMLEADGWTRVPRASKDYLGLCPSGISYADFRKGPVRVEIAFYAEVIYNETKGATYWYDATSTYTWTLAGLTTDKGERGKGHASRALDSLLKIGEAVGVKRFLLEPMNMNAQRFGGVKTRLSQKDLMAFYGRHGFVAKDSFCRVMERLVKSEEIASVTSA